MGETLAELVSAHFLKPIVVTVTLHIASGRHPEGHAQERCFPCLASFLQRLDLLSGLCLDEWLLGTIKLLLQKLLPAVRATCAHMRP